MAGESDAAAAGAGTKVADPPSDVSFGAAIAGAFQALIVAIIAAAASLGFVAFVGGAVLWARYYSLGLPPDQIVAAVPQRELVATGASVLAGFGVLGLRSPTRSSWSTLRRSTRGTRASLLRWCSPAA